MLGFVRDTKEGWLLAWCPWVFCLGPCDLCEWLSNILKLPLVYVRYLFVQSGAPNFGDGPLLPFCDLNKLCSDSDLLPTLWHSGVRLICSLGRQLSVFHITNLGAGNSQGAKSWLNLTDFLPNVSLGTLHILGYPFYGTQISYSWNLARKSQNSKFHHIIAYFRRFCLAITLEGISNSGKDADTRKILLLRDECAKK